jgi:hypothetical protein
MKSSRPRATPDGELEGLAVAVDADEPVDVLDAA